MYMWTYKLNCLQRRRRGLLHSQQNSSTPLMGSVDNTSLTASNISLSTAGEGNSSGVFLTDTTINLDSDNNTQVDETPPFVLLSSSQVSRRTTPSQPLPSIPDTAEFPNSQIACLPVSQSIVNGGSSRVSLLSQDKLDINYWPTLPSIPSVLNVVIAWFL